MERGYVQSSKAQGIRLDTRLSYHPARWSPLLRVGYHHRELLPDEPLRRDHHHDLQQAEGPRRQRLYAYRRLEEVGVQQNGSSPVTTQVQDETAWERVETGLLLHRSGLVLLKFHPAVHHREHGDTHT